MLAKGEQMKYAQGSLKFSKKDREVLLNSHYLALRRPTRFFCFTPLKAGAVASFAPKGGGFAVAFARPRGTRQAAMPRRMFLLIREKSPPLTSGVVPLNSVRRHHAYI